MPAKWQSLAFTNVHPRDKYVQFDEPTHIYTVKGETAGYISVTKFIHEFFPHFDADKIITKMMQSKKWTDSKWYGMTREEIKATWNANGADASTKGTAIHLAIEQFLNGATSIIDTEVKTTPEWRYFMNFWNTMGKDFEPYRTEWEVWSEEYRLTGSIDMIFRRKSDGKFVIYDWKRSKEIKIDNQERGYYPLDHLGNCNYWIYTLQLNIYRWFLQTYYGLEIVELALIVLHPDSPNFKRIQLNILDEEVADMMEARLRAVKDGCRQKVILPIPACAIDD
jgi:ATP-dependent exoDNAse (exonuclease V) beta subunit